MANKGFTLLELSIVIVIIGLIVAGISAGQSLVRQSQLRSVISFTGNVETAVNSFVLQYDALPGDISNAYDFWGTAFSCTDALAAWTAGTGCNGDGDGYIETFSGAGLQESYRAWGQLSYLGLMDGSFTGNYGNNAVCTPGTTAPEILTTGGAYISGAASTGYGSGSFLQYGAVVTNNNCYGALFTPPEAKSLDEKLDDGDAGEGRMRSDNGPGGSSNCLASGDYDLSYNDLQCWILYRL